MAPINNQARAPLTYFQFPQIDVASAAAGILQKTAAFNAVQASQNNLTEPLSAVAEWAVVSKLRGQALTQDEWWEMERQRQLQKTIGNHLGEAQQDIIGSLEGWRSFQAISGEPDVVGMIGNQKIIAEIKNKKNTTNSSSENDVYESLSSLLDGKYAGYLGIMVNVMHPFSKKPFWRPFAPGKKKPRADLIRMTGRVFYAVAADPMHRQPTIDFDSTEDLREWSTWTAFDTMCNSFYSEIETQTGYVVENWLKDLLKQQTRRPEGLS